MPVTTRSQKKNAEVSREYTVYVPSYEDENLYYVVHHIRPRLTEGEKFKKDVLSLLDKVSNSNNKTEKIKNVITVFEYLNQHLDNLIRHEGQKWYKFVFTVYDKIKELEYDIKRGQLNKIEKNVTKKFTEEISKTKEYIVEKIEKITYAPDLEPMLSECKQKIAQEKTTRPKRNIARIDYSKF